MATHDPKDTQFPTHLLQSQSQSDDDDEEELDAMFMSTSDEDEDVEIDPSSFKDKKTEDLQRICLICNKGFSSGKALGGHSRIHAQPSNKKQQLFDGIRKKMKTSENPNQDHNLKNGGNTCCVCGKSFPSEKSLFGHMRCHPDRNWRGILPPPTVAVKYSSAAGNKNSPSSTLSEAEFVMPDGHEDEIRAEEDRNQIIDSAISTTTTSVVKPLRWLSTAKRGRSGTKEHVPMCSDTVPDDVVRNLMMLAGSKFDENVETMQKKKRRKLKFRDLDTFKGAPNRYKCATCDKAFPTHQALGGHRSSHNKVKTAKSAILREDREPELQCSDELAVACSSRLQECSKISYAAGEEAHMSCHGTSSTSQAGVSSSGEASNTGRGGLDFDLNEVPEVEIEDEIITQAADL